MSEAASVSFIAIRALIAAEKVNGTTAEPQSVCYAVVLYLSVIHLSNSRNLIDLQQSDVST